jgi:uncharacterized membrane protein
MLMDVLSSVIATAIAVRTHHLCRDAPWRVSTMVPKVLIDVSTAIIVGAGLGTIVGAGLGTIVGAGLGTIVGAGLGTKVSYC